ncbi:MAG TPA: prephenate dehydrogenase [Nocardioidaceae bacterium]|nr:prephenate dehydrogenase [Nocardioidaceae bacterium]
MSDRGTLDGPVLVIGCGLIGTSVGLALRHRGVPVHLQDKDPQVARTAAERGAGDAAAPAHDVAVVVVAVPPDHVGPIVVEALRAWPRAVVTDVGSVKTRPLEAVARATSDIGRYVGGHPMAGSERSGPLAASVDLFAGRVWAVTPHEGAEQSAVDAVAALARLCGAEPVPMSPAEHDEAVARVSHVPHVLAVLAAARLDNAPGDHLQLSGQGIRDVTRIAAGDPGLWQQILAANSTSVVRLLSDVRADLDRFIGELSSSAPRVQPLLRRGVAGTRAIPGKHGGPLRSVDAVFVLVPDRPGELGRLLVDSGAAGVNIEDIRIDHVLGRPSGLVELSVPEGDGERLVQALADRGWSVHR